MYEDAHLEALYEDQYEYEFVVVEDFAEYYEDSEDTEYEDE